MLPPSSLDPSSSGAVVMIVNINGATCSGKSTLAEELCKLYCYLHQEDQLENS